MPAANSARARRTLRVLVGAVVLALAAWAGPAGAGNGNGGGNGNGPPPEAGPPPDPGNGNGNGNGEGNGNGNANGHGSGSGNPHGPSLDSTGDPAPTPSGDDVLPVGEPSEPAAEDPGVTGAPPDADPPPDSPVKPDPESAASGPDAGAEADPAPEAEPKPEQPAPAAARAPEPPPAPKAPPPAPSWTQPIPLSVPAPKPQTREQQVLGNFSSTSSDVEVVRGVNGAPGVRVVSTTDGRFSLTAAKPFVAGRTPYRVAAWLRTDSPGITVCLRFMEKTAGKRSRLVRSSETCVSPTATWQRFRVEALSVAPGNVLRVAAVVYGGFEGASFELSRLKVERKLAGRWTKVRGALVETTR